MTVTDTQRPTVFRSVQELPELRRAPLNSRRLLRGQLRNFKLGKSLDTYRGNTIRTVQEEPELTTNRRSGWKERTSTPKEIDSTRSVSVSIEVVPQLSKGHGKRTVTGSSPSGCRPGRDLPGLTGSGGDFESRSAGGGR